MTAAGKPLCPRCATVHHPGYSCADLEPCMADGDRVRIRGAYPWPDGAAGRLATVVGREAQLVLGRSVPGGWFLAIDGRVDDYGPEGPFFRSDLERAPEGM